MASALTTVDNPYDPITQFDDWYNFDMQKGYNSAGYLARVARTSPEMCDRDYNQVIDDAIKSIVKNDFRGIYIIYRDNAKKAPEGG